MNRRDFLKRISKAVPVVVGAKLLTKIPFEEGITEIDWHRGEKYRFLEIEPLIFGTTLAEREKYKGGSVW